MAGFPFKTEPSPIQLRVLKEAWGKPNYGLLLAMGAGKTKITIDLAGGLYIKDRMSWLIIICPNAIKDVWNTELGKHSPVDYEFFNFSSGDAGRLERWFKTRKTPKKRALNVVAFNIEAFSQGKAVDSLNWLISEIKELGQNVGMAVDEASKIKNHSTNRTKKVVSAGHRCDYRWILTGTPITQGLEDLFAQFYFLDPAIIGLKSYVLFKRMYCIEGGFDGRKIVGYYNEDILYERLRGYASIVTKEEALPDLPPKIFNEPQLLDPTPQQKAAFKALKEEMEAEMGGDLLTTSTAMDVMTRIQQICGGFFPFDKDGSYETKPIEGRNPKLIRLMELVDINVDNGERTVIWARFRPELELIASTLRQKYGNDAVCEFHGGIADSDRPSHAARFSDPESSALFMVANPVVGGMGQTWVTSRRTIYYSNTFSYEDRKQSEDRNHRRGQHNSVSYDDLVINVEADKKITKAIARKHDVAMSFNKGMKVGELFE